MHILNLADAVFRDKPGGSRQYAREMARCFREAGHRVSFLVPRIRPELPHEESVEGCRVVRYDKPDLLRQQVNLRLAFGRLNADTPVDAVLVHFAYTA
ncbi:MAG: glycosyltransferase [Chthonomonadales bacterium]|nr:glycosyltransferase [Chthonomonadales bacterium]